MTPLPVKVRRKIPTWNGSEELPQHWSAPLAKMIGFIAVVSLNWGFIRILIFLLREWGTWGLAAGITFVPPLFVCPVWEWIATDNPLTFLLVYLGRFGGLLLYAKLSKL